MSSALQQEFVAVLAEGKDMTIATLHADGAPQTTTVSYASDGEQVYFGCSATSQKARNLLRDGRIALTVNLPYVDWSQIRGVTVAGRARRLEAPDEAAHFADLFLAKFPEVAQYVTGGGEGLAMFEITPEFVSVLDYRKGFGHVRHAKVSGAGAQVRFDEVAVAEA